MKLHSLMAAAVLAVVPAAARADDTPVRFYDDPSLTGSTLEVKVWIAFGYGKQIVNDNGWNEDFGTNYENASKHDGDVVVRLQAGSCMGEIALVGDGVDGGWSGHLERMTSEAGFLWTVQFPFEGCGCPQIQRVKLHCQGQGEVKETCHTPEADPLCVSENVVTVQALNRPTNEKCTTDLGGDDAFECDLEELAVGTTPGIRRVYEYTPVPGQPASPPVTFRGVRPPNNNKARWTFEGSDEPCTDSEYAAGCTAICLGPQWDPADPEDDATALEVYPTNIVGPAYGDFDADCSTVTAPARARLRTLAPAAGGKSTTILQPKLPARYHKLTPATKSQRPGRSR